MTIAGPIIALKHFIHVHSRLDMQGLVLETEEKLFRREESAGDSFSVSAALIPWRVEKFFFLFFSKVKWVLETDPACLVHTSR